MAILNQFLFVPLAHLSLSEKKNCTECDIIGISGEELTLDNFKDNGKRFPCDDNPDNAGCKRAKQINNMDSFQGSPSSGLIYKNIILLFCLTFTIKHELCSTNCYCVIYH
jgi:hypothetical protein